MEPGAMEPDAIEPVLLAPGVMGPPRPGSDLRPAQHCIQALVHACQCYGNCPLIACYEMKRIIFHTRICKRKASGRCPICLQLGALFCYHAKRCQETKCPVPLCDSIAKLALNRDRIPLVTPTTKQRKSA